MKVQYVDKYIQFVLWEEMLTTSIDVSDLAINVKKISFVSFHRVLETDFDAKYIFFSVQGGIYLQTLLDWYPAGYSPMIMGLLEILVISYVYGKSWLKKFPHWKGFKFH